MSQERLPLPRALFVGSAVSIALLTGADALATDYTYTYVGNPFPFKPNPDVTNVSGTFTSTTHLSNNSIFSINPNSLVDFTFTDGSTIWDKANDYWVDSSNSPEYLWSQFQVRTSASGNIDWWNIALYNGLPGSTGSGRISTCRACVPGPPGPGGFSLPTSYDGVSMYNRYGAGILASPGTWTVSSVPENGSNVMALAGIALLSLLWRGKSRSRPKQ